MVRKALDKFLRNISFFGLGHWFFSKINVASVRGWIGRNWDGDVCCHLPALQCLNPEQDHHERLRQRILSAISDSDLNWSVGLRNIRRDEHYLLFVVKRVDAKRLLIHVM